MDVASIAFPSLSAPAAGAATPATGLASFGKMFGDALGALQQSHSQADGMTAALAAGQDVDLHQVMLALEHASLATQLAVQVRNKLVEAYQEISRMQV